MPEHAGVSLTQYETFMGERHWSIAIRVALSEISGELRVMLSQHGFRFRFRNMVFRMTAAEVETNTLETITMTARHSTAVAHTLDLRGTTEGVM